MITLPSYFQLAKIASYHSNFKNHKMGSVIVHRKPLSFGYNIYGKTHPKYSDQIKTFSIHAEISAIIHAQTDLDGSTIFIFRDRWYNARRKERIPALAKPCIHCYAALKEAGIIKAYFTISKEPYYEIMEII